MQTTIGERFADARLALPSGQNTMTAVSAATGVQQSLISDLENDRDRSVGYQHIKKLAIYYNVSIDWLLGLTEEKTVDVTLQSVCRYSSLSQRTIEFMHSCPETELRHFLRLLFDGIIRTSEDHLYEVIDSIKQAAQADILADRRSKDKRRDIENAVATLSEHDGRTDYLISPMDAKNLFELNAQAALSKCLVEVLGTMENQIRCYIESEEKIPDKCFSWIAEHNFNGEAD